MSKTFNRQNKCKNNFLTLCLLIVLFSFASASANTSPVSNANTNLNISANADAPHTDLILTNPTQSLLPTDYIQNLLLNDGKGYSVEEIELINDDFDNIKKLVFRNISQPTLDSHTYVATAGGPGSSKSTLLEKYRLNMPNYVYLDPDQRVLKLMTNTYLQEFTNAKISKAGIKTRKNWEDYLYKAYSKWRSSSNYIVSRLLNEAYDKGYNIFHGTTSTSPQIEEIYKNLKQKGYKIVLLLCYSTDENRVLALQHRTEVLGFYRLVPEEIVSKGKVFPERFPIYFKYADEIQFYWVDNFLKGETLAATLYKNPGKIDKDINPNKELNNNDLKTVLSRQYKNKSLNIVNAAAFKKFTDKYGEDSEGRNLISLETLINEF